MIYFWYAERKVYSKIHPELNHASGLVEGPTVQMAWSQALQEARANLGNTKAFTIRQFNEVSE